jgi:hypothetical protein
MNIELINSSNLSVSLIITFFSILTVLILFLHKNKITKINFISTLLFNILLIIYTIYTFLFYNNNGYFQNQMDFIFNTMPIFLIIPIYFILFYFIIINKRTIPILIIISCIFLFISNIIFTIFENTLISIILNYALIFLIYSIIFYSISLKTQ